MKNSTISTALAAAIDMRDREVPVAQREIGGPDRREQQDEERDEDRGCWSGRGNVLVHR